MTEYEFYRPRKPRHPPNPYWLIIAIAFLGIMLGWIALVLKGSEPTTCVGFFANVGIFGMGMWVFIQTGKRNRRECNDNA